MISLPFGQTLEWFDLLTVGLLIILEGVLSIDNALVLGLLAKRLPAHQRKRALTYGLVGAFVFRAIAIVMASYLLQWKVVKLIGGGYLAFVALKYFLYEMWSEETEHIALDERGEPILVDDETGEEVSGGEMLDEIEARTVVPVEAIAPLEDANGNGNGNGNASGDASGKAGVTGAGLTAKEGLKGAVRGAKKYAKFWPTVVVIELTDIAFAVDSILAALALISTKAPEGGGMNPKLWVVFLGGILGVVLMRVAAVVFIKLLERFPRFEVSAYLLVLVIAGKLMIDWYFNSGATHDPRFDFHKVGSPAFNLFWLAMLLSFLVGFLPKKEAQEA
jgi:predicted tellurium resistance membrane protein TerC